MDLDNSNEPHYVDWAKVIFSIIICCIGLVGNFLTIFVIVVLKEYKKSVTHWYVLQLALADTIFLITLPFKSSEDINNVWLFPNWMCKAKESILFINYYASVLFLMIMSIDRYIAVCHSFSEKLQKFRRQWAASCITVVTWVIAILLCTPIAMYSTKTGMQPNCKCRYELEFAPKQLPSHCPAIIDSLDDVTNISRDDLMSECVETAAELQYEPSFCKDENHKQIMRELMENLFGVVFGNTITETFENDTGKTTGSTNLTVEPIYNTTELPDIEYPGYTLLDYQSLNVTGGENSYLSDMSDSYVTCDYSNATPVWKGIIYFNFFIMFLFPIGVMVLSYGFIIKRLRRKQVRTTQSLSKTTNKNQKKKSTKSDKDRKRVTMMCATLVISFFLCWVLFHSYHLAKLIGIRVKSRNTRYCETLGLVGSLFGYLNSALNPYLYNLLGTNFSRRWSEARRKVSETIDFKFERKPSSLVSGRRNRSFNETAVTKLRATSEVNSKSHGISISDNK